MLSKLRSISATPYPSNTSSFKRHIQRFAQKELCIPLFATSLPLSLFILLMEYQEKKVLQVSYQIYSMQMEHNYPHPLLCPSHYTPSSSRGSQAGSVSVGSSVPSIPSSSAFSVSSSTSSSNNSRGFGQSS